MCYYLLNKLYNLIIGNNIKKDCKLLEYKRGFLKNEFYYVTLNIKNKNIKLSSLEESYKNNEILYKEDINNLCKIIISRNIFIKNEIVYKISQIKKKEKYFNILTILYYNKVPNIIIPYKIYENINNKMCIQVLEYKKFGDLFTYITDNNLKYYEIYNIFYKIILIIKNLHDIDISHRDIKLENFVIDYTPQLELFLIDFDYADTSYKSINFKGGSWIYAAPELFTNKYILNFKCVDMWALCIILYSLLFKRFPWNIDDTINNTNNHINKIIYDLFKLDIPLNHKIKYSKIFKYGLNLKYNLRTDINKIISLL